MQDSFENVLDIFVSQGADLTDPETLKIEKDNERLMLEMEKIGLDIDVGGILMQTVRISERPVRSAFRKNGSCFFCVERMGLKIKMGIHFLEVGIINRSCHVRSPFRMAAGIVRKQILGRMARINERILRNAVVG